MACKRELDQHSGKRSIHRRGRRTRTRRRVKAFSFLLAFTCSLIGVGRCYGQDGVDIQSAILRNRVVVLDQIVMKKALYVAFALMPPRPSQEDLLVQGQLLHDGVMVAEASLTSFRERAGNLVFDLPYEMRELPYTISIHVRDGAGRPIASGSRSLSRLDPGGQAFGKNEMPEPRLEEIPFHDEAPRDAAQPTDLDRARGYIVFSRSSLSYIYPDTRPRRNEIVQNLSAQAVRNAFATLNFALHPLRELGELTVVVSDLYGQGAVLSRKRMRVACVVSIPDAVGMPKGKFRAIPALLEPAYESRLSRAKCQRIWIRIRVDGDVPPGIYTGAVTITPQHGRSTSLPIRLTVAPISLEDVPSVDYCMLMTYEFTELTMPWTEVERKKIYSAAVNVLRDYKEHGMTTVCIHSPFVLITDKNGLPDLSDIFATLRAVRELGFTRPVVWYMGHLIQTAKPKHPGNIGNFDPKVQIPRLRYLVDTVSWYAKSNGLPEVVFLPIDEPDDSYQDPGDRRRSITPLLVKTIKEAGAKSMVTAERYKQSGEADYLASYRLDTEELNAAHSAGSRYWRYENRVALDCSSPAYARYQYGYYTWKNNIDGMSSWTFQNTQNAAGPPRRTSAPKLDVYLAYPAPTGPISTIKWEAIRDGIDDRKLIYQLVKRIAVMKRNGGNPAPYENLLKEIREMKDEPCCDANSCKEAELSAFDRKRQAVIRMILRADGEMH